MAHAGIQMVQMMGNENQFSQLLGMLAEGINESADELAQAQYNYYESLVDAGFTEEQAMTLVQRVAQNTN